MSISRVLEEKIRQIEDQKQKLYEKVMSEDGFWTLWDRFLDLYEFTYDWSSLLTSITHLLLIELASTFQIPELTIEIPELTFILPPELMMQGYRKAIYGVSRYDESYYDPVNWTEAVKRLFFYIITQVFNYPTQAIELDAFSKSTGIPETYIYDLMSRVQALMNYLTENIICGFWICGVSKLSKPEKVKDTYVSYVPYIDAKFNVWESDLASVFEASFAPVCGRWVCGFGRVVPRSTAIYKPILPTQLSWWIINNVREQMNRFILNLTGFKLREAPSFYTARKPVIYGEKFATMYNVDAIIRPYLESLGLDPVKVNAYLDFAREYIFGRVKTHRPSKRGFKYLDVASWETYIIEKWKKAGLDESIMRKIIETIKPLAEIEWARAMRGL